MAKLLHLEVAREQYGTLSVSVPDDFDEGRLLTRSYRELLGVVLAAQKPYWETDQENDSLEVQGIVKAELGDETIYRFTDLTAPIAELEKKKAEVDKAIADSLGYDPTGRRQ